MIDLVKEYNCARERIRARAPSEVSNTVGILPAIMRAANGGPSGFDPEALVRHGIDPLDFRTTQAINYAKLTLGYHDHPGEPYIRILITRLEKCLEDTDRMSFGNVLPDDIKQRVKDKLELNRPPQPQGMAPNSPF